MDFLRYIFNLDFFRLYANMLAIVLWVYFAVVSIQSLWNLWLLIAGSEKYMSMLRRYLLLHGLRLRFRRFWGDIVVCILLCVAFFLIWRAQWKMYEIEDVLQLTPPARHS